MFYLYGLFRPSLALELCLNKLKENGFSGNKLEVVVLDQYRQGKQRLLDSMYSADGMSLVDGIAIAASVGMLMGVIYGSQVSMGPVALGLTGMTAGGALGYLLDRLIKKKKKTGERSSGEIIVSVVCYSQDDAWLADQIMRDHHVMAVGRGPDI